MDVETIKAAWEQVFPNGAANSRSIMGSTCVALYVQSPDQWTNGIANNDPLNYTVWIEDDNVRESDLHLMVKPEQGSFMAYGSAKMRKQTIKNADYDKLVKRFKKVRAWIEEQNLAHEVNL